ncbi:MAG: zf-HC2 domain-containing protein [Chloroflexota bacterium]|nr:zf-HC2 domain-containing protein [Chloroflexota bacterium]
MQHPHAELSAYIDKALDPAAQSAVAGHLDTCALCRAHVAQLRATASFVRALPDPVPSRRLVPRFAPAAPAWLAPLRTLMTIASGAAVFLFIASTLVTNITFLAGSGAATTALSAPEAARDAAGNAVTSTSKAAQPASSPVPAPSPQAGFALGPTASPLVRGPAPVSTSADDAKVRTDQATAGPSGAPAAAAYNPQDAGRLTSAEPQRSPLLNPWLWLALAIVCAGVAIALQRRLRVSI